jgi:hypothetical protein
MTGNCKSNKYQTLVEKRIRIFSDLKSQIKLSRILYVFHASDEDPDVTIPWITKKSNSQKFKIPK